MGTLSRSDSKNRFQFGSLYDHHGFTSNLPQISSHHHQINGSKAPPVDVVECDYFGGVYDYIKKMLMEEEDDELDQRPFMFQDCSALQAAEKCFYDALINTEKEKDTLAPLEGSLVRSTSAAAVNNHHHINRSASGFAQWSTLEPQISQLFSCEFDGLMDYPEECLNHQLTCDGDGITSAKGSEESNGAPGEEASRRSRARDREDDVVSSDQPSSKQFASCTEESMEMGKYDKSLFCPNMNPNFYSDGPTNEETSSGEDDANKLYRKSTEVKRGRPKGSKKNSKQREVVDLTGLLTRCAQAVSSFDAKTSDETLRLIRRHSSPYGDPNERLAHYFANGLEARMSSTGPALYASFALKRISALSFLKSYQAYVTSCPFKRMSNIFANKTIARRTIDANRVHIIDFGISHGFQWPCIIQGLSLRPGGPPSLKITGIDFPQPGFRPAEKVEQTGARLADYCKRFNVPFEYNAVAKRWDEIDLQDLKIEGDEAVIVNCLYRMRHVPDESSTTSPNGNAGLVSLRDAVLRFIREINPRLFVHGVVNGSHNAPFFSTRFREALRHYSSFFDMLECTLPREDEDRLVYEREVFGREVMNVVACEGSERVERPEGYKQWQVRNRRAGFRQVGLVREVLDEVRVKVKSGYHSCFLLDEDGEWMIQGWKGRVMYALSCWEPL